MNLPPLVVEMLASILIGIWVFVLLMYIRFRRVREEVRKLRSARDIPDEEVEGVLDST